MLILTNTTDNIEVVLNAAHTTNPLRCVASWRDITASAFTPGRSVVNTSGTTPVDAVVAPAASTQRVIDFLSVFNSDTTNKTVTIQYDANGTKYQILAVTLGPNERIEYSEGRGFVTYNSAGAEKLATVSTNNAVSTGRSIAVLGADVTNNNATANTIADVTGLSFPVVAGNRYRFRFVIPYTSAATGTGSRFSINGPASPTELAYQSNYSLSATSETINRALTAYDLPAAANAQSLTSGNIAIIEGIIRPSADGNVIARFASEVASSAIVAKAGAFVEYEQL